jgi:hypothetical protein
VLSLCYLCFILFGANKFRPENVSHLEIIHRKSCSMVLVTNLFPVNYIDLLTTVRYGTKINETGDIRSSSSTISSVLLLLSSSSSSHLHTYVDVAGKNGLLFYYDAWFCLIRLTYTRRSVGPVKIPHSARGMDHWGRLPVFQAKGVKLKHRQTCRGNAQQ